MQNIVIDEEFRSFLPSLDKEAYSMLEENLLQNGCRDSLVLWGDILIDGHNRYEICTKYDIPFKTINRDFNSREEALIWIISTQMSRRNLTTMQLSYFRGRHYRADKKIVTNANGKNQYNAVGRQNDDQPKAQKTTARLASQYHVSPKTIERDAKIANAIDIIGETMPEVKRMILAGEAKIDKKVLEEFSSKPAEDVSELAVSIGDGTYEKKKPEQSAAADEGNSQDVSFSGLWPLKVALNNMTEDFYSSLRRLMKNSDPAELKSALKICIDMLEVFYKEL